jgi:opacity protein-like surface antigen
MKHIKASLVALGALLLAPAVAQAAPHAPHWSAAALLGYGFEDGANLGLGARFGYSLRNNIYLGGLFQYHFGETNDYGLAPFATAEQHFNVYYFGFEGGYDFHIDDVVIRPYMGIGPGFEHRSLDGNVVGATGDVSDTDSEFAIWFGGTVLYQIDDQWFIGGDFRLPVIDGDVYPTLAFTGGLNF